MGAIAASLKAGTSGGSYDAAYATLSATDWQQWSGQTGPTNGNLTWSHNLGTSMGFIRATAVVMPGSAAKRYYEVHCDNMFFGGLFCGFSWLHVDDINPGASNNFSMPQMIIMLQDGHAQIGDYFSNRLWDRGQVCPSGPVTNDTIGIYLDEALGLAWWTKNGTLFNNDVSASPATGVGGVNYKELIPDTAHWARMHPIIGVSEGAIVTCNFGGVAWTLPVVSGYTGWAVETNAHRFWRWAVTANNGGSLTTATEIELQAAGVDQTHPGDPLWVNQDLNGFGWTQAGMIDNVPSVGGNHGYATGNNVAFRAEFDLGHGGGAVDLFKLWGRDDNTDLNMAPKDWTLWSSNNLNEWTLRQTVTGATGWVNAESRTYAI